MLRIVNQTFGQPKLHQKIFTGLLTQTSLQEEAKLLHLQVSFDKINISTFINTLYISCFFQQTVHFLYEALSLPITHA